MPGELGRHELDLIVTSHFQQLGHDSQHRLFKFFAWAERPATNGKEAKTKAVNGGYTDYLKLGSPKLDKMTTAQICRLLVDCALTSELYFPKYCGATSLKDTKLARETLHYNLNCDRVLREVKEKLRPEASAHINYVCKIRPHAEPTVHLGSKAALSLCPQRANACVRRSAFSAERRQFDRGDVRPGAKRAWMIRSQPSERFLAEGGVVYNITPLVGGSFMFDSPPL